MPLEWIFIVKYLPITKVLWCTYVHSNMLVCVCILVSSMSRCIWNVCNVFWYIWRHNEVTWPEHVVSMMSLYIILLFWLFSRHRELTYLTCFLLFEAIALQIEFSDTVSCCFVCFDFELHFFCLVTMAKGPKRKYISKNNQEQLL